MKYLQPIEDDPSLGDKLEKEMMRLFRDEFYLPLMRELYIEPIVKNSAGDDEVFVEAIRAGRLIFVRGSFRGKFSAAITKKLKSLGAKWDTTTKAFKLPSAKLPKHVRAVIEASKANFDRKAELIDRKLAQFLPEEFAERLKISKLFDGALWKAETKFKQGLAIEPIFTDESRARISDEYTKNFKRNIADWTKKEIVKLRGEVQKSAFAGNRYETMIDRIQKSYGVSQNKAKFLARQETNLLMAKFKETRYADAGVEEYQWVCAAGSPNHPVRPMHKKLNGKTFRFDNPPVVNLKGDRKNPGEDYGCRCFARPIVRF